MVKSNIVEFLGSSKLGYPVHSGLRSRGIMKLRSNHKVASNENSSDQPIIVFVPRHKPQLLINRDCTHRY